MQIREHAEANPDKPAVILYPSGTVVTFGEMEARANRLAHLFRQAGLREGDAVAILMENNEHYHTVMWAARRSGLYYVPINSHLTAAEAAYIIDNSAAKAIVGSAALRPVLEGLGEHLPNGLPELLIIADEDLDGWLRYPECVADQPDTPIDDEIEGDLLQYSSGTTGRPKGIKRELPHLPPSEAPGLMTMLVSFWMDPNGVYLSPAPLYHTAPSVWSMTMQAAGIPVVVMEKFDAEGTLDAIQRHGVTHGQFVPVMFTRMLKLPESVRNSYDLSTLQRVMHAAAPCPVEIKKQMIDWWGPIVDEYYASSEAIGSTLISAEEWLAHPGSVGKPMGGNLHILDEEGNELPPGQPGEIYFETGASFEYLNDAEKTAASRHHKGWMTVGDIGYLDDEGYLLPHRPPPPHDHLRRGQHLSAGSGEHARHPSEGDGRRGVRDSRRGDGPERQGCGPARRPCRGLRGACRGAAGLAARSLGALQVSAHDSPSSSSCRAPIPESCTSRS